MRTTSVLLLVAALLLAATPAMALSVGDPAPAFTAQSNQGEVSLAQYLGKKNVVLAFYFKDLGIHTCNADNNNKYTDNTD